PFEHAPTLAGARRAARTGRNGRGTPLEGPRRVPRPDQELDRHLPPRVLDPGLASPGDDMSDRRRPPKGGRPPAGSGRTSAATGDSPRRPRAGGLLAALLGFGAAPGTGAALLWGAGCSDDAEADVERSRATTPAAARATADARAGGPEAPPVASARPGAAAAPAPAPTVDPAAPWPGPVPGAMAFQPPIYPETRFGDQRVGYIRQGG